MNAPAWLPVILAVVMLAIAAYSLWRIAVARVLGLTVDIAHDVVLFLLAAAVSGMLVRWMNVLRPGVWAVVIGAAGLGIAIRALLRSRRPAAQDSGAGPVRVALAAAGACGVGVYMLLAGVAPSAINGSTAGSYTMAGMPGMDKDTTITFPALGIALSVVLVGYAVVALDRIGASPAPAPRAQVEAPAAQGFAPVSVALCEIAIVVTMAYAILAKLV